MFELNRWLCLQQSRMNEWMNECVENRTFKSLSRRTGTMNISLVYWWLNANFESTVAIDGEGRPKQRIRHWVGTRRWRWFRSTNERVRVDFVSFWWNRSASRRRNRAADCRRVARRWRRPKRRTSSRATGVVWSPPNTSTSSVDVKWSSSEW